MSLSLRLAASLSLLVSLAVAGCSSRYDAATRARFDNLTQRHFRAAYAFNPSFATYWGVHDYDDSLENWNAETIAAEGNRLRQVLEELETIDPKGLDDTTRIDYDLFRSGVSQSLYELTEMRGWQKDPGQYNFGFMLESMIARNFAPPEQRLRSLTTRLRHVPRLFANARANLENPPAMFTEFAAGDLDGTISYLENDVSKSFASVTDPALRKDFEEAKAGAIAATKEFAAWLRSDLQPRSTGSFVIGEDAYRKRLLYGELIEMPLDSILAIGQRELDRLKVRSAGAARKIDPAAPLDSIVARMRRDHPTADSLLPYVVALSESARAFTIRSGFIEIPSEVRATVRPTPEFAASRSFASFDGPGPFETKATDAFYNVTLPNKTWTPERVEEHLQGYSRWTLPSVTVHEVYPGHYTHFLYARRAPTLVRKGIGSGAFGEGWGLYTEEALLDAGFGGGDPRVEFGVMRWALIRACRLQVGIRVHTRGMTIEEGTRFFVEHAGMEPANAEREAFRAAFDPMYSIYTIGALQIRKLRDDVAREQEGSFDRAKFHATILSQGSLPVVLLRRMMLKEEGASL
ncbi:MAG TPA: DUF885 domain-containing protein [Candidatus Eisenbacteria bacterium]|nr:DUF885 domain-containing protein [Candidatus Eisenbacteria bacterium]